MKNCSSLTKTITLALPWKYVVLESLKYFGEFERKEKGVVSKVRNFFLAVKNS